jgi:hypothetical protein
MKYIILFIGLFCTSLSGQLTVPWVLQAGGMGDEFVTDMCFYENSLLVTGPYRDNSLILGKYENPRGVSNTSAFIGAIDQDGEVEYLLPVIGSNSWITYTYIEAKNEERFYALISSIADTVFINENVLINPSPSMSYGLYLVELDRSGKVYWSQQFGVDSLGGLEPHSLSISKDRGFVYALFSIINTDLYVERDTLIHNYNPGYPDIIGKWGSEGDLIQLKMIDHSTDTYTPSLIETDASDCLIHVSNFRGDWVRVDSHYVYHPNIWWNRDLFTGYIIKMDENLNVQWSRTIDSHDGNVLFTKALSDKNNNIIVTGIFQGEKIIIGNDTLYSQQEKSSVFHDYFITKLDSHGNPQWAKSLSLGAHPHRGGLIDIDSKNNIYGHWMGGAKQLQLGSYTSTHEDRYNSVITRHNQQGELEWYFAYGSDSSEISNGIVLDDKDNLLIATTTYGHNWNFEGHHMTNSTYDSITGDVELKLFFAKIIPPKSMTSVTTISSELEVAVYPNPASDRLVIRNKGKRWVSVGVSIFDMNGRMMELYPVHVGSQELVMDVAQIQNGSYVIQLETDRGVISKPFIISR